MNLAYLTVISISRRSEKIHDPTKNIPVFPFGPAGGIAARTGAGHYPDRPATQTRI
jgi:hypothetical protein